VNKRFRINIKENFSQFRRIKTRAFSSLTIFITVCILVTEFIYLIFYIYLEKWKIDNNYGFYLAFIIPLIIGYVFGKLHIDLNKALTESNSRFKIRSDRNEHLLLILAHDVRSPVKSLFILTERLGNDSLPLAEAKVLSASINRRSSDTLVVIDNLLSWIQSQTMSLLANIQKFDIGELILIELREQKASANLKDISLDFQNHKNSFPFGDQAMVSIIIRNILNNSIKFTDIGGKISIELRNTEKYCLLTISDTGSELNTAHLPSFYAEPINEFGSIGEKKYGLGLKLSQEYALKNNGALEHKHNHIGGVTATLKVPLQSY